MIHDSCLYHERLSDGSFMCLLLYMDDMIIAAKGMSQIDILKKQLSDEFKKKDCYKKDVGNRDYLG